MTRVFLGGTTNNTNWRDSLEIELARNNIEYFNPVVKDWNDKAYKKELSERETCDFVLYVITPKMIGVYSIAEVIDDSNKRPDKTIFAFIKKDEDSEFNEAQIKSLNAVAKMVVKNGGVYINNNDTINQEIINAINQKISSNKTTELINTASKFVN